MLPETKEDLIFNTWLGGYRGLIFKVVHAFAFTAMDRDDLFQEVAVQLWRSVASFRQESSVTTWIYRIALNTAIKWQKKERRQIFSGEPTAEIETVLNEGEPVGEQLDWLYQEIYKLDEIDRSVTLLMLDGLSYREMASILGITESHVGVKINRIKKQLIERSKKYDHGI
jgi:RNA polymerase sigma-70 factor (ECF subfamily)